MSWYSRLIVRLHLRGETTRYGKDGDVTLAYPVSTVAEGMALQSEVKERDFVLQFCEAGEVVDSLSFDPATTPLAVAVRLRSLCCESLPITLEQVCDIMERHFGVYITRQELRMAEQQTLRA